MVLSDSLVYNIFGILIAIIILINLLLIKRYRYWKDLGVECRESTIPFGNFLEFIFRKMSITEFLQKLYDYLKSKKSIHGGTFFIYKPVYVPIDLNLIKHIMQIDFTHFTDHVSYVNEKDDPLSAHLFALEGQRWRQLRNKLTPTFTSGKMKTMFPIMVQISEELIKVLQKECDRGNPIESKDISARFTTDVIGSCAFGLQCNSLVDPNTEFRVYGKRLFNFKWYEALQTMIASIFPDLGRFFHIRLHPKEATDFFWKIIKQTVDYREQTNFKRNDAIQLLIDMKVKGNDEDNENTLTFNEIAAQAFLFFAAGFDTSSISLSFALLELAINQDVQDKLREEINMVLEQNDNELTYTALQEMKYCDMVISETLRKYPPIPGLTRICTKDYRVPNTDIVLNKGTYIIIPTMNIHYDPEYYPNPEVFDPIRFNDENKNKRHQFAYLPFGEGPRVCIGMRFGLMQSKVALTAIIKNFKIKVNSKTTLPIKLDPKSFLTNALGKVLLDLEKI